MHINGLDLLLSAVSSPSEVSCVPNHSSSHADNADMCGLSRDAAAIEPACSVSRPPPCGTTWIYHAWQCQLAVAMIFAVVHESEDAARTLPPLEG